MQLAPFRVRSRGQHLDPHGGHAEGAERPVRQELRGRLRERAVIAFERGPELPDEGPEGRRPRQRYLRDLLAAEIDALLPPAQSLEVREGHPGGNATAGPRDGQPNDVSCYHLGR